MHFKRFLRKSSKLCRFEVMIAWRESKKRNKFPWRKVQVAEKSTIIAVQGNYSINLNSKQENRRGDWATEIKSCTQL